MKRVHGTGAGTASQYWHSTAKLFSDHVVMAPDPPNNNSPVMNQGTWMCNGSVLPAGDGDESPPLGNTRYLVNGWNSRSALWVFDKMSAAMLEAQFGPSNNAPTLFDKMPHITTTSPIHFLGGKCA